VIEVAVRFRRRSRQTAVDGTVGPLTFAWQARSKAGHGVEIDGTWGADHVRMEVHERRLGTGVAIVTGTVGTDEVHLDISRHLQLGLDVSGTIGNDDIGLRLDRPVGSRRRIVHRQPQPDATLQVAWQNLGGTLSGGVTRSADALAATLVGLAAADTGTR